MNYNLKKDIIQWDIEIWSKSLDFWGDEINISTPLKCLEIGSRQGGLSLWAAIYGNSVICSDLFLPSDSESVRNLHTKYDVTKNISYEAIDVLDIPYDNYFDIVLMKSVLPSLGDSKDMEIQRIALKSIFKSLKPGGKLLFAENLEATFLHRISRKWFVKWGKKVKYLKTNEVITLLNEFGELKFITKGFFSSFGRNETQRKFLGKIDTLLDKATPSQWKYLMIGILKKK
ncbi:class I SAM-dependent methyltransferase [Emticicia sp. BO119]|nr:class I SAM-dependent methyltransferase [Emticicia sp. BO119]